MRAQGKKQSAPMRPEAALLRLESLCARAEHCSYEIMRKLAAWQISREDADTVLDSLVSRRFVDDARFARSFVRDKYRFAQWGRRKIELGLRAKRLDSTIIRESLGEIDSEEYENILRELLCRKAKTIEDADTYEGRTRLFRFAASRGFEPDLIARLLRQKK